MTLYLYYLVLMQLINFHNVIDFFVDQLSIINYCLNASF